MSIVLQKPLVIFDLETTGTDIAKDRIVQIAFIKIMPDGTQIKKESLINPGIPIPKGASDVHGITDDMVKDKPTFANIAKSLITYFEGCDYAGYNIISFDIPLLHEEFLRCGLELPKGSLVDSCNIFKKREERTLSAAVKFYCDEEMVDAHDAMNDVVASLKILEAQTVRYSDLPKTIEELAEYSKYSDSKVTVDYAGWFTIDGDGDYVFGRGKHKDVKVRKELGFLEWMLRQSFLTIDTMNWAKKILDSL